MYNATVKQNLLNINKKISDLHCPMAHLFSKYCSNTFHFYITIFFYSYSALLYKKIKNGEHISSETTRFLEKIALKKEA